MERTLRSTLFFPTIVAMVFSVGCLSLAQESAVQSAKQLKAPDGPAIYEDSQWAPDQDVQLLSDQPAVDSSSTHWPLEVKLTRIAEGAMQD